MNLVVFLSDFLLLSILMIGVLFINVKSLNFGKVKVLGSIFFPVVQFFKVVKRTFFKKYSVLLLVLLLPSLVMATEGESVLISSQRLDLTMHWAGYLALVIFAVAYILAMTEEVTELKKSKPMVFAASLIWIFIAGVYTSNGMSEQAGLAFRSSLEGYAELFLFIMVSMTYLNAMEDRGVFDSLRVWLLSKNFTYRQLFWITGFQSFFISAGCNNLTTALLMGSVILAMGKDNRQFVTLSCINVVVASNAGGSFSPFGDITTLLVWQKEVVPFVDFFALLIPAIINFVIPATIMNFFIPKERPSAVMEAQTMKRGGWIIIFLFVLTIVTSACFENYLRLPPAAGMMLGLTYLKFFSYYLQKTRDSHLVSMSMDLSGIKIDYSDPMIYKDHQEAEVKKTLVKEVPFDIFQKVANLEWDTLLFFYGVMVGVGGLSFIGYLGIASHHLYGSIDPTLANILVGIASAFVEMFTIDTNRNITQAIAAFANIKSREQLVTIIPELVEALVRTSSDIRWNRIDVLSSARHHKDFLARITEAQTRMNSA